MSSTNKTNNLKLNSWLGSDKPQRADFNSDNEIIDSVITEHSSDTVLHTTADEKQVWNNPYEVFVYYGNGASSRSVTLTSSFAPRWGIVFAASYPVGVTDIANETHYNYFGFFSTRGSNSGITLKDKKITVVQSATAVMQTELRNFNENGVTYVCILFR